MSQVRQMRLTPRFEIQAQWAFPLKGAYLLITHNCAKKPTSNYLL